MMDYFPPLGRDFSDELCERYERARGFTIDRDEAWEIVRAAAFNPRTLGPLIKHNVLAG
jgi:hypothetical protein